MTIAEERELYERMRDWIEACIGGFGYETAEAEALVRAYDHLQAGSRPQAAASLAEARKLHPRG